MFEPRRNVCTTFSGKDAEFKVITEVPRLEKIKAWAKVFLSKNYCLQISWYVTMKRSDFCIFPVSIETVLRILPKCTVSFLM